MLDHVVVRDRFSGCGAGPSHGGSPSAETEHDVSATMRARWSRRACQEQRVVIVEEQAGDREADLSSSRRVRPTGPGSRWRFSRTVGRACASAQRA
eukprot:3250154-Rhodomonas_salina.3